MRHNVWRNGKQRGLRGTRTVIYGRREKLRRLGLGDSTRYHRDNLAGALAVVRSSLVFRAMIPLEDR